MCLGTLVVVDLVGSLYHVHVTLTWPRSLVAVDLVHEILALKVG